MQAKLPIVIGGKGRVRTLRTVARFADQWDMTFRMTLPHGRNSTTSCVGTVNGRPRSVRNHAVNPPRLRSGLRSERTGRQRCTVLRRRRRCRRVVDARSNGRKPAGTTRSGASLVGVVDPINEPCAWLGQDLVHSDRWIRDLDPEHIEEIEVALSAVEKRGIAWHEITAEDFPLPGLANLIAEIRNELENGCGLMKLRGVPVDRYDEQQLRKLYFGIGANVGTPVLQNRSGQLMRLIRDEGSQRRRDVWANRSGRHGRWQTISLVLCTHAHQWTIALPYRSHRRRQPALCQSGGQWRCEHDL